MSQCNAIPDDIETALSNYTMGSIILSPHDQQPHADHLNVECITNTVMEEPSQITNNYVESNNFNTEGSNKNNDNTDISSIPTTTTNLFYTKCYTDNALQDLHKQWGHLSERYIKKALQYEMIADCPYTYNDVKSLHLLVCFDCMKGRAKAEPARETCCV